jgi:excisionase family DNA binding protein
MKLNQQYDPEELLSANEAGKLLGVSGKTTIRMMEAGDFPGYRIGNAWKFKRGDVIAYRESRKFRGGNQPGTSVA